MENIYQTIVEYKDLYPTAFWMVLSLVCLLFVTLVVKLFKKKKKKRSINVDDKTKSTKPQKSRLKTDTNQSTPSLGKGSTVNVSEKTKSKEKPPSQESNQKVKESGISYESSEKSATTKKEQVRVTKSQKSGDNLPEAKKESKKETKKNLFVNYESNIKNTISSYPVFISPNKGCVVRSHRIGSTKRRGYKEKSFQLSIGKYFSPEFKVSGNIRLNTGKQTRPFEPDIAILDLKSDKNIRIDIEIDEPYAGITRQATHCDNEDYLRDCYFVDRGWIVIRFSEYQVHTQLLKCLKFIATVITSIKPEYSITKDLESIQVIDPEPFWNLVQAQKWEKEKYREKYLNHTFQEITETPETVERDFDDQEIAEENLVEPSVIGEVDGKNYTSFNKENAHPRDNRIEFYPDPHVYTIDKVAAPTASTIVSKFFPEFDMKYWAAKKAPELGMTAEGVEEMWKEKGKVARDKGTLLHEQIEKYYLEEEYKETGFKLFRQFESVNLTLSKLNNAYYS